jgi:hypothetical protein
MAAAEQLQFRWERAYTRVSAAPVFRAVAAMLTERGFDVRETEPPVAESDDGKFRAALRGVRDVVLDARRRFYGKLLLAGSALMTLVTFWLIVSLVDDRALLEWLLTIIVIVGGYGLMQLKEPPKRMRRIVDVRLTGGHGDCTLSVGEGVCLVEDERAVEWPDGETAEIDHRQIADLVWRTREGTTKDETPEITWGAKS